MLLGPLKLLASANDRPSGFRREIETYERVVRLDDRKSGIPVTIRFGEPLDFVLEYIWEAFDENER